MQDLQKVIIAVVFILISSQCWLQEQMNYLFSTSQGVYEPISDGDTIWQDSIFAQYTYVHVPAFEWDGLQIDSIGVSSNGWVRLGTYSGSLLEKNPFWVDGSMNGNQSAFTVVGLGHLLVNSDVFSSVISYKINDGVIIFEYKNVRRFGATAESLNFQIQLNTNDESVLLSYGDFILGTFPSNLNRESQTSFAWNYNRANIGISGGGYLMLKTHFGAPWSEVKYDFTGGYGCMFSNEFPVSIPVAGFRINFQPTNGIVGCMNESAINYSPDAEIQGWCEVYTEQTGCLDSMACNYDALAIYDGECSYGCLGCTDPAALDYNPISEVDMGNCVYSWFGTNFAESIPIQVGSDPWYHLWSTYLGMSVIDGASPQAQQCTLYSLQLEELTNLQVECPAIYGAADLTLWLFTGYGGYVDSNDDGGLSWLPKLQFLAEPNVTYNLAVCGWTYNHTSFLIEVKPLPLCQVELPQLPTYICQGSPLGILPDIPSQFDPYWIVNDDDTLSSSFLSYSVFTPGLNTVRLVSDFAICPIDTLYEIEMRSPPTAILPNDTMVCQGDIVELNAQCQWPVSWNWQFPNNTTIIANYSANYIARFVDDFGCMGRDTLHVTVLNTPNTTITQSNQTLQTSGVNYSNQWFLNGEMIDGATGLTYTPIADGFYSVTQSLGTCYDSSEEIYFDYILPLCLDIVPPYFPAVICDDQELVFALDAAINDSFSWIINATDTTENGQITSDQLTLGWNQLTLFTELEDCPVAYTTEITTYAGPTYVEILSDSIVCVNDFLFLEADGSGEVDWGFGLSDETYVQISEDMTFIASVMNACDFVAYDTLHVDAIAYPILQILSNDTICEGDPNYQLVAEGNGDMQWGAYANESFITVTQDTLLYVTSTNDGGCMVLDSLQVDVLELPLFDLDFTGSTLIAPAATTYQWYFNGEPISGAVEDWVSLDANGSYYAIMTNSMGCEIMSEIFNYIPVEETKLLQLNIFPNPASQSVTLVWKNGLSDLRIVNSLGETVGTFNKKTSPFLLTVSDWSNGLYYIEVKQDDNSIWLPLIKHE